MQSVFQEWDEGGRERGQGEEVMVDKERVEVKRKAWEEIVDER